MGVAERCNQLVSLLESPLRLTLKYRNMKGDSPLVTVVHMAKEEY